MPRCINIEKQAIFITWSRVEAINRRGLRGAGLWTERGLGYGLEDGVACGGGLRCLPTQLANWRSCVSNAARSVSVEFSRVLKVNKMYRSRGAPFEDVQPKAGVVISFVIGIAKIDNGSRNGVVVRADEVYRCGRCSGCVEDCSKQQTQSGAKRYKYHDSNAGEG